MSDVLSFPTASEPGRNRIRVIEELTCDDSELGGQAFVTIGLAETNVTVLDEEARVRQQWRAAFGWSFFFEMPFHSDGGHFYLEEQNVIKRALSGEAKIFGHVRDTRGWRAACGNRLRDAVDEILQKTVGSGAGYDRIVLAMPEWMLPAAESMRGLRLNLENNIEIEEI